LWQSSMSAQSVNCVVNIDTLNIRGILILLVFSFDLIDSFYHRANTCDNYFMRKKLQCSCRISFNIANHFFLEDNFFYVLFHFAKRISSIFFYIFCSWKIMCQWNTGELKDSSWLYIVTKIFYIYNIVTFKNL